MNRTVLIALAFIVGLFTYALASNDGNKETGSKDDYLTPVTQLRDAHGLAIDTADSNKVWIASHTGLHLLKNDKELFLVGSGQDDYMGFSTHPTDPNTFFTSGHPTRGGNLGFQKSTDAGKTWQRVSDGLDGPVDFHSMTVDRVDPATVYGVYQGKMQKSKDGGKSWESVSETPEGVIQLVAGASKNTVFAATHSGLQVSRDQAKTWDVVGDSKSEAVISVAANPKNEQELMAYSQGRGLAQSQDSGATWTKLNVPLPADELVLYIAYDPSNPSTVYMLSRSLAIYKTTDGGASWSKVRS